MDVTPHGVNSPDVFQDAPSPAFEISPADLKRRRCACRRESAARFINCTVVGASVPSDTDEAFRAALADGVILCSLLNCLKPGCIRRIVEVGAADPVTQAFENLSSFFEAATRFTTDIFTSDDLDAPGERPQVADCVLSLQDWHQAALQGCHTPQPPASYTPAMGTVASPALTPGAPTPVAVPLATVIAADTFSFTPAANQLVSRHAPSLSGETDGLNYLMQSCTHMLKTRMGVPATPLPPPPSGPGGAPTANPEIALDAVGPVLETVLANLTSEYERRLLAKDQEHKQQAGAVEKLQLQVEKLEAEAAQWREAAESGVVAAQAAAALDSEALRAKERAEYERLRASEAALLTELAAKREELAAVQTAAAAAQTAADNELAALRREITRYGEMEERYKTVREENRQLYNTVQDLRGNIRVFCRVRPSGATGDSSESVVEVGEEGALAVYSDKHSKWHQYAFDRVFGEDSQQQDIYQETKPLVRSVLDGFNVCIFAYGQTGSGKTHTMSGAGDGINFKALEDLFDQREDRAGEVEYSIRVQLVEIYNEVIRDLLVHPGEGGDNNNNKSQRLGLQATRSSGSNLPDATQIEVRSAAEVAALMERGSRNRAVAETKMNERSSRSHQVLTVIVEGFSAATHARSHGALHLIDLAGSERVSRSGAAGQQLIEAQHINKSLTALGCVMQALAQKRDHIPFRDSKLTQLLADSLSGQAKSMMFIHIAPEESSVSETLSTLNFGRGVTEITLGAAKRNVGAGSVWEAREVKKEAREAKNQLKSALQDAAEEREARLRLEDEVAALRAQVEEFKQNAAATIPAHRPSSLTSTGSPREWQDLASGLARPPQVGRLNLAKLAASNSFEGAANSTPERINTSVRSLTPLSARGITKIPPPLARSGSLTARPSFGQKSSPLPSSASIGSLNRSNSGMNGRELVDRVGSQQQHRRSDSPVEAKPSLAAAAAESMLPRSRSSLGRSPSFRREMSSGDVVSTPRTSKVPTSVQSRRWM